MPASCSLPSRMSVPPRDTLVKRPWRTRITPLDRLLHEKWQGSGTEENPYLVNWITDDAENPQTWPDSFKWAITTLVSLNTLIVSLSSSTYAGCVPDLIKRFPAYSEITYIAGLSVFVLGFALGPLLWAPLSEVWGRRQLFIVSYILFTAFNAGLVASQGLPTIIVLRFLSGCAGSSPLTNAGGTVSDVFNAKMRGTAMAVFASAPYLGPAMGPIVGGFLGEAAGFRWVFGLVAILTAILTIVGILATPETYAPVLLRERAERLHNATGKSYRSIYEKDKVVVVSELFRTALSRPWKLLFLEPIVLLLSLYMAVLYGTLYLLFAAFPIVYQQERGWSPGVGSLAFIGVAIGFMAGLLIYVFYENPRYARLADEHDGFAPPEARLHVSMIGAVLLPIGIFIFAATAYPVRIHWIASMIATVPFGVGMVLIFLSVMNYLVDAYLLYAASVLAANTVLRSLFGAAFPLFTDQMYARLGINWASALIGFLALICAPMPFLFVKYGADIRLRCKFAAEAAQVAAMIQENARKQRALEQTVPDDGKSHHSSGDQPIKVG